MVQWNLVPQIVYLLAIHRETVFFVLFCFVFLNDGLNYLMRMLGNIDSIKLQYCSLSRKENDVFAFSVIFYFNCRRYFKLCSEILRWIFKLKM